MAPSFRQAICNEAFERTPFAEAARSIRHAGYTGLEIAPFTLADDPPQIDAGKRREYRDIMASEGLTFVGLHWLMVSPNGLHVTTPDTSVRHRSWNHVRGLIDLCADLGPGGVMVFGSPVQRASTGGLNRAEATQNFVDGLASIAPDAERRQVTVLVEALPFQQTDVVQSLEEAAGIVRQIASPYIQTMFDVHNAINEVEPHAVLVDRYFDWIRHIHVNEMDGRHCGTGDYDFRPLLGMLATRGYNRWISLEAFDFTPGGNRIATESLRHLEKQIAQLNL